MQRGNRKSAPQVVKGRVQKKNNWKPSEDYFAAPNPRMVVIDRQRPGEGYKHMLSKSDIYRFLELLPDWNNLAVGLNAIVLAPGEAGTNGWHTPGVVAICAWEIEPWHETSPEYYNAHAEIFARLGVECEEMENGWYRCQFHDSSIRAYQLLHILLHELGHHHDRMTTRSQKRAARGETYAENYAIQYEAAIWQQYQKIFRF